MLCAVNFGIMEVTIIEMEEFDGKDLIVSTERKMYPRNMDELKHCPIGWRAKKIRLNVEFDVNDIPKLLEFLQNSQPCFG